MTHNLKSLFVVAISCCCLHAFLTKDRETGLDILKEGSYSRASVSGTGGDVIIRDSIASPVLRSNTWEHGDGSSILRAYEYIEADGVNLLIQRFRPLTYPHVEAQPATLEEWQSVLWKENKTITVIKVEGIRSSDNPLPHKARASEGTPFDVAEIKYDVDLSTLHWWNPVTKAPEVVLERLLGRTRTQVKVRERKSSGDPFYTRGQGEECMAPITPEEELARFRALFPSVAGLLHRSN